MKKYFLKILIVLFASTGFSYAGQNQQLFSHEKKDTFQFNPLFQLAGGLVYSSIDLSRYISSIAYRGYHARLVTHIKGVFFLSTEYSSFPVHDSPSAWENVHTRKFDINGHISFATNNKLTWIFILAGANKHEWTATRTGIADLNQLGGGITKGAIVNVNRWGMNFGCGFTQTLYENIGVFGDCRFCFGNANNFEKVRIMDVMTTIGINFSIPQPTRKNNKKTFGIGRKVYKWTQKGSQ